RRAGRRVCGHRASRTPRPGRGRRRPRSRRPTRRPDAGRPRGDTRGVERRLVPAVSPMAATVGYSRAVRAGDTVSVAGTAPVMPDGGDPPADAYGQAKRCLEIIVAALAELGAGPEHVVRT